MITIVFMEGSYSLISIEQSVTLVVQKSPTRNRLWKDNGNVMRKSSLSVFDPLDPLPGRTSYTFYVAKLGGVEKRYV